MPDETSSRILNMLGALAVALADLITAGAEAASNLHASDASALVLVSNHPGESFDTIRRALGLTHSGAVRLVDRLEGVRLVERHRHDSDARAVALWATPAGVRTASAILAARAQLLELVLARTSKPDKKAIAQFLENALAELTNGRDRALSICRFCSEGVCRPLGCPVEQAASRSER
jgi:MarR family transcriptional repressor of emrRAB